MNFNSAKQKSVCYVTSSEIIDIVFDLVFGFNEHKEIKFFDGDNRDIVLEGFISFMQGKDFSDSIFSTEIKGFVDELDRLYYRGINNCKLALERLVKALDENCCKRGEKASVESVIKIQTALLSVGVVEIFKGETETVSGVLRIVAILTNILVFFTRSGL